MYVYMLRACLTVDSRTRNSFGAMFVLGFCITLATPMPHRWGSHTNPGPLYTHTRAVVRQHKQCQPFSGIALAMGSCHQYIPGTCHMYSGRALTSLDSVDVDGNIPGRCDRGHSGVGRGVVEGVQGLRGEGCVGVLAFDDMVCRLLALVLRKLVGVVIYVRILVAMFTRHRWHSQRSRFCVVSVQTIFGCIARIHRSEEHA